MKRYCGIIFRIIGYALVPMIAMLAYFHVQCLKEKEIEDETRFDDKFDPHATDVISYSLNFTNFGDVHEANIGINYILTQSFPCAFIKLLNFITGSQAWNKMDESGSPKLNTHQVSFIDARKNSPGNFHETGFTLIELDNEPLTKDWRCNPKTCKEYDIDKFHLQMEPYIKNLYPDVKRIRWTFNVVRGGSKFMDQPKAVNIPHLDYHQNRTAREEFHQKYSPFEPYLSFLPFNDTTEPQLLMGEENTDTEKLKVLLGVWIPILPDSTVCDNPLAVMDARTFDNAHQTLSLTHINFGFLKFHNLGGGIVFDPKQKWYYYPFMTNKEVLVFHQYSEDRFFANPHTSFSNRNCPKNTKSRISAEMRLALYF